MWEMAPGRCKFHGFLLAYFSVLIFYFFFYFITLRVTKCLPFSPVVCRKISEASQVGEWVSGCFERD